MILLQTVGLTKSFGINPILSDISIQIQSTDRIGLVGVNGAGKSTLLKIIAGKMLHDQGEIQLAKGTKIGYLAQDSGLETEKIIWDEMLSVFSDLIIQEKKLRELEIRMSSSSQFINHKEYERLMDDYAKMSEEFKEKGGYAYEAKIRGILHGLGFSQEYYVQPVSILSGGQKTRLALAKLLLEMPELLILDEPTNYLDIESLSWLEGYLKSYTGAVLIVSHDRYFLDSLVNIIYEIEETKATRYTGNYSKYLEEKANRLDLMIKKYEKQQTEISKMESFIQKNIARASTTKRAQSRRKMLEKMEKIERPTTSRKKASIHFQSAVQSGEKVLSVSDLSMGFENRLLFENVSFSLSSQERVALIGPNGIGKSTLFKLIKQDDIQPLKGSVHYGSNVTIGYYDQEQEDLGSDNTVLDEIWDSYPTLTESEIRTTLGRFLFMGEDVYKKIKELSGGEKARVALSKLMLKKANLLLLDEPTNHLDLFNREVLEEALLDYTGTILFISHDRYFLNKIATRILEFTPSGIHSFLGNYDYYLEKKSELEETRFETEKSAAEEIQTKSQYIKEKEKQKAERQVRRKIESIENEIEHLENRIVQIESELLKPEIYSDYQISYQKNEELNQTKQQLHQFLVDWEKAQKELEDLL